MVNLDFLTRTVTGRIRTISAEMRQMGESILLAAKVRAAAQGAQVRFRERIEKETGASLTFFRVMDAEFLDHATIGPLRLVYGELHEVAKFAMLILRDRARRRGVTDVDYFINEGNVRAKLRLRAAQASGDILVMGRPIRSPGSNVFKVAEFDAFVAELERERDLRVVIVSPSRGEHET